MAQSGCAVDRESWRRTLGERIAERSVPDGIHGATLTVKVASSVWAQELSLLAPEILQRLQNAGFSITELRWRVGPLAPLVSPRRRASSLVPLRQLPDELERTLGTVEDNELRNAIFQAAAHVMARQQRAQHKRPPSVRPQDVRAPQCAEPETSRQDPTAPGRRAVSPRIRAKQKD